MLIFDGHLDLAMNALEWNRDLTRPVAEIRRWEREAGLTERGRGRGTVAFPEMRQGGVGLCLATVIARVHRPGNPLPGAASAEIACARARGQLAYYRILEEQGVLRILTDWPSLEAHARAWETSPDTTPIGIVLTMEGADPILRPEDAHRWQADGLRCLGLSHYGVSRFAHGTATEGGLTELGRALLPEARRAGLALDLTHLADRAFWEALERFDGPVHCSHQNCRALVPGDRQMTDEQLRAVIERGGVIGAALDAWMLYPGWIKGVTSNTVCSLAAVADQIDHVCQLAGNSWHAAIGSDLDGGFGQEQSPHDLDTIADLPKLGDLLRARGYTEEDVRRIFHGNWLRFFREAWGG